MANRPMVSCSTGAMNSLLDKLTKLKNHSMLQDLQKDLESLNDCLDKFAGGRETDAQVKVWKKQVRELVYDIEDWIEPKPPPNLGESDIKQIEEFKAQINEARERFERYDLLRKAPISDANPADVRPSKVTIDSRPLWEEKTVLVAVDGPKTELEKHLKNEDDEKLKVVSIVGMEGHGKTTLAKEIYGKLQGQFECHAFVSVGRRPSMRTTLMDILRQVKKYHTSHDVQGIITELWEFLGTKRYFIVIDGIWSTWDWKVINCALPDKNRGSRVLTTTCIMDVAESCSIHPSDAIYRVEDLSKDESRSLFDSRMSVPEEERPVNFKEVSDDMLKLCSGMPLAVIVTAGLLAWKSAELGPSKGFENSILSAKDQYSTSQGMRKILYISYSDLSLPVKSCFMYLRVFPENCTIKKDRLIRLWVAEGFIPKRDEESLWETGESYFNELISRRLIQPVFDYDDGQAVGCTVHGVILDFIASLSREDNFVTTGAELRAGSLPRDMIRRFSFGCSNKDEDDTLASSAVHLSRVRSLIFFGDVKGMPGEILHLRFLRVLDLEDAGNLRSHHLKGIEGLVLLRYLGLGGTGIHKLPEEIGELQHLEALDLRRTTRLLILPASIVGLRKLVSLLLHGRVQPPEEIWKMQELEEVSAIAVRSSSSLNSVSELLSRSNRLRMLGVRWDIYSCDRRSVESFLNWVGESSLQSLLLQGYPAGDLLDLLLDSRVPLQPFRRFELIISGTLFIIPPKMASLENLTHLRIQLGHVAAVDLRVLRALPKLILLDLHSKYPVLERLVISDDGFRRLVVFCCTCGYSSGMGLQFTPGAMPELRSLRFETESQYGDFDFGIQHVSRLTRVHATIRCRNARDLESADAAEASIRYQVSKNPNSPVLELKREEQVLKSVDAAEAAIRGQVSKNPNSPALELKREEQVLKSADAAEAAIRGQVSKNPNSPVTMEFATGAMGSLLNKLGEVLKEYKLQKGMREQVESLSRELEIMHAALRKVAEVPREHLDEQVKLWARDVKELSYDMEDIVDTILVRVEDGRDATPNPHWLKELMENMSNFFIKANTCHQFAVAIEDINKQLREVTNRHGRYPPSVPAASTSIDPRLQALYREATELVGIYGKRDQELIKMLSEGDDVSKKKLKIVSVVGFGGLGKTTLAKAVYDKIKGDFHCRAFVSVGRNPNVEKVFKDILLDLDKQKYTEEVDLTVFNETKLIDEIREFLENKRYLIIIDDIWDEKLWGVIKLAFSKGNNHGSRLITTTRKGSVSDACCSSSDDEVYKMEPLSDDDSQRLFYQRIFPDRSGCPPELEQVSSDILKKCGGVPLAIITIASLLAGKKQTKDEWYTLLNSIGRGLTKPTCVEDMQRILSFSYYDLPPEMKTCLLYISVFPEDYVIDRDQLIWMWIAEGFIQCEEQQTSLFELGESYFNELINRSMIQPLESYFDKEGRGKECRVHDMVLDLICALSSEENSVTILDGSTPNLQSKVRRLSLQNSKVDQTTPPYSVSQVRSIAIYPPAINLMPPLSSFRVLRVLNLRKCDLGESINLRDVGNLFHLRYLGLADTGICELPKDIGKLQFLQVLDVTGNRGLSVLPSTVVKLRRLMCLHVDGIRLPDGIGNLTSMEVLHIIFACPNIVKELRNLTRLREFTIFFPPDGPNLELEEAFVESLRSLQNIQSLNLACPFGSMDLFGEHWVPPPCLRSFRLAVREFSTMPAWVKRDHSRLSNLSDLHTAVKELRQEDLQTLGMLPALRSLQINITHQKQMLRLVVADWFKYVIFFEVKCELAGHIVFQRGALPRAEEVEFPFDVRMAKDDGNGDFDAGLGNLLSLRNVGVTIFRDGDTVGEAKEAEAALRHAVDAHPNHPTIKIDFKPFLLESDDDDMDSFISDGEEFAALDGDFSLRRRRRGGRAGARGGRAGATSASDGDKDEDEDGPEKSS